MATPSILNLAQLRSHAFPKQDAGGHISRGGLGGGPRPTIFLDLERAGLLYASQLTSVRRVCARAQFKLRPVLLPYFVLSLTDSIAV